MLSNDTSVINDLVKDCIMYSSGNYVRNAKKELHINVVHGKSKTVAYLMQRENIFQFNDFHNKTRNQTLMMAD